VSGEPWTPGPWEAIDLDTWPHVRTSNPQLGDIEVDLTADALLIAGAPEMAALLAELDEADGFISAIELYGDVDGENWMERRAALLARIRGEA